MVASPGPFTRSLALDARYSINPRHARRQPAVARGRRGCGGSRTGRPAARVGLPACPGVLLCPAPARPGTGAAPGAAGRATASPQAVQQRGVRFELRRGAVPYDPLGGDCEPDASVVPGVMAGTCCAQRRRRSRRSPRSCTGMPGGRSVFGWSSGRDVGHRACRS